GGATAAATRRALVDALWRARVLAGDVAGPLAEARGQLHRRPGAGSRYDYGVLLLAARRPAAARAQLRVLLDDPRFGPDARRIVAVLDFQAGRDAAASAEFDALLASGHHVDDAYYYLGLIADRDGAPLRALRFLARVRGGDNALPAMLQAAAILRAQGADAAADAMLQSVVIEDGLQAPEIIALRARLDVRAGRPAAALAVLDQGIGEYPDDMGLRYARASARVAAGQVDAALAELRAVLARRPQDPEALNAYGYTLADQSRQLDLARALIERALRQAPHDAAIRDSLAWVLFRQGRLAAARANSAAAYAESPGGDIGAHYGEILWRLGRHAQARRIFAQAAAIDPESRLLMRTRARLDAGESTK
ncbi:MAG: tetratricopeptide repeat protein, partial [Gammaproteobacteria bacterium]|nr:tetratricopeptide repeat protein [Gammaproteobacteria bacterium]